MTTPVISMREYRLARRAAGVLTGLMHEPPWLQAVRVEVRADGEPVIVAVVNRRTPAVVRALPRSIDGIKVFARGAESKREAP